jgi:hypothetical protein
MNRSSAIERIFGNAYLKSLLWLLGFLSAYSAVELVFNLNRPYWGDEGHFIGTVRQFGTGLTLEILKHYNEMSTPLPFALYASWGRVVGYETQNLRLLSIMIACLTYISFHRFLFSIFHGSRLALLTTIFFSLNPYMLAFSIFVFTDMSALLFLILCCAAIRNENVVLFAIASTAALLCRQYLVFVTFAAGTYFLVRLAREREAIHAKMLIAAGLSTLPLFLLFWMWQGFNPDNTVKYLYLEGLFNFHLNAITLYVLLFFVYLLPIVLWAWKLFYRQRRILAISAGVSWLYLFFPIVPSKPSIDLGLTTVGVFHRAVQFIFGFQAQHIVLFLCFLMGLPIVVSLIDDTLARLRQQIFDFAFFLGLAILAFLLIMPFSYLAWEKYFLPAMPLGMLWMLLKQRELSKPLL